MAMAMPMLVLSTQSPNANGAALSSSSSSIRPFSNPNPNFSLFSKSRLRFSSPSPNPNPNPNPRRRRRRITLSNLTAAAAAAADGGEVGPTTPPLSPPPFSSNGAESDTVFVGDDGVPIEGVIQFDKPQPTPSKLISWAQVGLLAGGDVLCLVIFSAIGRFSHGFPVLDFETLQTADPFIAGWFLSAYFLGGYGDDGKGFNGTTKAIIASTKSWVVGIPLGILIRSATSGHIPPATFMLVTMGSTGILLNGWRALVSAFLSSKKAKKNDVYKRGSPFELFELLTSLVRRW